MLGSKLEIGGFTNTPESAVVFRPEPQQEQATPLSLLSSVDQPCKQKFGLTRLPAEADVLLEKADALAPDVRMRLNACKSKTRVKADNDQERAGDPAVGTGRIVLTAGVTSLKGWSGRSSQTGSLQARLIKHYCKDLKSRAAGTTGTWRSAREHAAACCWQVHRAGELRLDQQLGGPGT